MSEIAKCGLCGEPMPDGEEMFMYHGFSVGCPKPAVKIQACRPEDRAMLATPAGKELVQAAMAEIGNTPRTCAVCNDDCHGKLKELKKINLENATKRAWAETELASTTSRAAADAEDAARYRWLRDERNSLQDGKPFIGIFNSIFSGWTGEDADRVVDAARESSHGK